MKKIFNTVTQTVNYQVTAKLLSVSDNVLENIKGTQYRLCTISFKDAKDVEHRVTASIFENNFKYGMKVGQEYLTTINPAKNEETGKTDLYFSVSHLEGTPNRVTAEELSLDFSEVPAEVTPA